jgi:hypothetical protein
LNLDTIIVAGMVMAFVMPALALVSMSLPVNGANAGQIANVSQQLNNTGIFVSSHLIGTYSKLNQTLLGANGSFSANPTIYQAYAFIVAGLSTIMTDIVQLPYLDYYSLNVIFAGMSTVVPASATAIMKVGIYLLYVYMGVTLLLTAVSAIQKYDIQKS